MPGNKAARGHVLHHQPGQGAGAPGCGADHPAHGLAVVGAGAWEATAKQVLQGRAVPGLRAGRCAPSGAEARKSSAASGAGRASRITGGQSPGPTSGVTGISGRVSAPTGHTATQCPQPIAHLARRAALGGDAFGVGHNDFERTLGDAGATAFAQIGISQNMAGRLRIGAGLGQAPGASGLRGPGGRGLIRAGSGRACSRSSTHLPSASRYTKLSVEVTPPTAARSTTKKMAQGAPRGDGHTPPAGRNAR